MCGIFGIVGQEFDNPQREKCARSLHHRGPDGFGTHDDSRHRVYLAHCRLAIIDLSESGAQPMSNEDGTVWITYNGEIYGFASLRRELEKLGHRFASNTDTEVILHAYEEWGIACLERLNGMFAFALWDQLRGKLFLARDRIGIKPLCYGIFGNTLVFASETRAIINLPFAHRVLNPSALCSYLLYNYVSGTASIWQGITHLLPAHYVEYDLNKRVAHCHRYWELPLDEQPWSAGAAIERFAELFDESVKNCLVSDVPVGVFLSGGYDSSAVSLSASSFAPQINTFCLGFEGWESDERLLAAETAQKLSVTHHEALLRPEHFVSIDRIIEAYDEPLAATSIFPTFLVSAFSRDFVSVALSGDGGDELFGGYSWHKEISGCSPQKRLAFMFEPLISALGLTKTPWGRRASILHHYRLLTTPSFFLDEIVKLFPWLPRETLPKDEVYLYREHLRIELRGYRRWQYIDLNTFLCDLNLMNVDRASMANSLEVRVPFLDHRMVEFAFSLPEQLIVSNGRQKKILGDWLAQRGLHHLLGKRKQGFSCPVDFYWPSEKMAEELGGGFLVQNGLIDRNELNKLIVGDTNYRNSKLWVLAILEKWGKRWLV